MPDAENTEGNKDEGEQQSESVEKLTVPTQATADHVSNKGTDAPEKEDHAAKHRRWGTLLQAGLLVVGIVYSFFACQQWLSMNQQIRIAIRTLHIDERAWVAPNALSGGEVKLGTPCTTSVRLRNTGKTPAIKVQGAIGDIWKRTEDPDPDFDAVLSKDWAIKDFGLIAPNGWLDFFVDSDHGATMTDERARIYNSGSFQHLIFGKLIYRDIFKKEHWVKYCYLGDAKGRFYHHGSYNSDDTTQDSSD